MTERDLPTVGSPSALCTHPTPFFEPLVAPSNQLRGLSETWNVTPVAWAMPAPPHPTSRPSNANNMRCLFIEVSFEIGPPSVTTVVKLSLAKRHTRNQSSFLCLIVLVWRQPALAPCPHLSLVRL